MVSLERREKGRDQGNAMKKGEIREGMAEKILFPNRGIVVSEGERAVVKNALPGQRVRFCVQKVRKGNADGRKPSD